MSSPPPPPPPSTQMEDSEAYAVVKEEVVAVVNPLEVPIDEHLEPKPDETGNEASPQLPLPPPPGPPVSRISSAAHTHDSGLVTSTTNIDNQNHDQDEANEEVNDDQNEDVENENDEEDDEILRVTSGQNGNVVEIALSVHSSKTSSQVESPIVPSVLGGHCHDSNSGSGSDQENPVSADDEGSRDGDEAGGNGNAGGPGGLCQEVSNGSVDCTPRTKKKVEHFRQGLAARRIQRTWKHFYEELEERKDVRDELPAPLVQVIEDKAKLETSGSGTATRPETETFHSPSSKCTSGLEPKTFDDDDQEKAVTTIEDAFVDHQRRERALAGMKAKIHTARPWQKKKAGGNNSGENCTNLLHEPVLEESSEEELERAYRALHLRGNDIRAKVSIIKADQELFTSGKVNEMKARLNERRSQTSKNVNERSDGITEEEEDDDDDVVIY